MKNILSGLIERTLYASVVWCGRPVSLASLVRINPRLSISVLLVSAFLRCACSAMSIAVVVIPES